MIAIQRLLFALAATIVIAVMSSFALSENQIQNHFQPKPKFTGVATYISKTSMGDIQDSLSQDLQKKLGAEMSKQFAEAFKNAGNSEFTLRFTDTESMYEQVEQLAKPTGNSSITVQVRSGSASSMIYKNLEENIYLKEDEILGKPFLIKDQLKSQPWEMHKESKVIGGLTCFKATYTVKLDQKETDEEPGLLDQVKPKEQVVTAWYTPQVPVSNGPGDFQGLPGLIMEVSEGPTTILCSEIQLNPTEFEEIQRPKEGKKINQSDFDELRDKKMEEYSKRNGFKKGTIIRRIER